MIMELKRIGQETICEKVIDYLQTIIINKTLEPGAKLPQEISLAAQLGVGRGTIREALRALLHLGYVERRGKSIYVVDVQEDIDPKMGMPKTILRYRNAIEMMEIRKIIEPEVAALVVKKADKASIKAIEDEFASMEANEDLNSFIEHDTRFHASMFRAIKNRALEAMMKNVYSLMFDTISLMLREGEIMPRSMEYHRKILGAIKEGDVDLARTYMLHHILDIEQEMYKIILSRKPRKRI
jgi:GntR family transcriptional repressor for pyruvate dehydrogenase complex